MIQIGMVESDDPGSAVNPKSQAQRITLDLAVATMIMMTEEGNATNGVMLLMQVQADPKLISQMIELG